MPGLYMYLTIAFCLKTHVVASYSGLLYRKGYRLPLDRIHNSLTGKMVPVARLRVYILTALYACRFLWLLGPQIAVLRAAQKKIFEFSRKLLAVGF